MSPQQCLYIFQTFPEALFHQLLIAMVHPDHETRVGAHRVFSVVLVPSSVCPRPDSKEQDFRRTLSRTVSVFSSSAALFDKLRRDKTFMREIFCQDSMDSHLTAPSSLQESQSVTDTMSTVDLSFSEGKSLSISYKEVICLDLMSFCLHAEMTHDFYPF